MMLRRDSRPGIRYAHLDAVRPRQPKSPPLFNWRHRSHSPLPEVWSRLDDHTAPRWRMLQRIVEQIRGRLLHLLVVELERRNRWIEIGIQPDPFALKCLRPPLGQFFQAIP